MYGHIFIISYITSFDINVEVNIFGNACSIAELASFQLAMTGQQVLANLAQSVLLSSPSTCECFTHPHTSGKSYHCAVIVRSIIKSSVLQEYYFYLLRQISMTQLLLDWICSGQLEPSETSVITGALRFFPTQQPTYASASCICTSLVII